MPYALLIPLVAAGIVLAVAWAAASFIFWFRVAKGEFWGFPLALGSALIPLGFVLGYMIDAGVFS